MFEGGVLSGAYGICALQLYNVLLCTNYDDASCVLCLCFSPTDCRLSELQTGGPPPDDNYPQCQQDQDTVTSITIPNGVVNVTCYSGRQFVSVASHVCDEGYQPNVTSSVRVCRDNGLWSGTTIVCGEYS